MQDGYLKSEVIKQYKKLSQEKKMEESIEILYNFILDVEEKDDILIAIIKGHLLIENCLEDLLENYVERYSKLNTKYFSEKLKLCYALDLIDKDTYNLLNEINKTRNKYGHDLNFQFKYEDLKIWTDVLSSKNKELYQELIEPYDDTNIFEKVTCCLQCAFMNVYKKKLSIHLIKMAKAERWYKELLEDTLKYLENETEK